MKFLLLLVASFAFASNAYAGKKWDSDYNDCKGLYGMSAQNAIKSCTYDFPAKRQICNVHVVRRRGDNKIQRKPMESA